MRYTFRKSLSLGLAVCLLAGALCLVPVVRPERLGAFGVKTDVWDQAGA